jgi:two-component system sensor histidine kinase PilS (NtrC family)
MATQARSIPTTIYHGYRILLILLLLGLALAAQYGYVPDQNLPRPFLLVCASYLPLAVLIPMLPARLLLIGFIIDVAATILMIHTSGGLAGSLAVLLLVVVASANILLPLRLGLLVASLATLAIIGEQAWLSLRDDPHVNFTIVGLLGLAFFATSLLVQQLALRLNRSEALGEQQRRAIAQLEELNRQIVSRLRTGILVFDQQLRILTANPAAQLLFDEPLAGRPLPVPLTEAYSVWRHQPWSSRPSLKLSPQMPPMLARFAHLHEEEGDTALTVLFLEDEARLTQEAQHLKLVAVRCST